MTELAKYDSMCRAIADCHAVDEVKDIRDKALAMEHYAKQALDLESERKCIAIRLRAERKTGQLLKEREKAEGAWGNPGGRGAPIVRSSDTTTQPKTLKEMGISKDHSSKWQKLADVPKEKFEAALVAPKKPSTTGIIRQNTQGRKLRAQTDIPAESESHKPPAPRKPASQRVDEIKRMARKGYGTAQIAQRLGVGEQRVKRLACRSGITLPDSGLRKIDPRRAVEETVNGLSGYASGLDVFDIDETAVGHFSPEEAAELAAALSTALRRFARLRKQLEDIAHD